VQGSKEQLDNASLFPIASASHLTAKLNHSALKVQRFVDGLKAQVKLFQQKVIVFLIQRVPVML
jgi:hypothetical protein